MLQDEVDLLLALYPDLEMFTTTQDVMELELEKTAQRLEHKTSLRLGVDPQRYPTRAPWIIELVGFDAERGGTTRRALEAVWDGNKGEFCLIQAFALFVEQSDSLVSRVELGCQICLDVMEDLVRLPGCKHMFCRSCWVEWVRAALDSRPLDTGKLRQVVKDKENDAVVLQKRWEGLEYQKQELEARETRLRERLVIVSGTATTTKDSRGSTKGDQRKASDKEVTDASEIERRLRDITEAKKQNGRERESVAAATAAADARAAVMRERVLKDAAAMEKSRTVPCPLCRSEVVAGDVL